MKILYGIQGTGNGHISRARMLAKHFEETHISVDYLVSGRQKSDLFDMEAFGDFKHRRGLTFSSQNGRVSYPKTVLNNNIFQFFSEVVSLNLDSYDLILTDFEPITAWAAKLRNKPIIGIGHQYAFSHNIPQAGNNILAAITMHFFAPVKKSIGLHWNAFNSEILPPIIDNSISRWNDASETKKIIVYLPFENQETIQKLLGNFKGFNFIIYSPELEDKNIGSISLRKTSYHNFKRDLTSAQGVICNSGFELISECLHLGLSILTKPQIGQMEQQSNAEALRELKLATTISSLNKEDIFKWLNTLQDKKAITYPNVAKAIVKWIIDEQHVPIKLLSKQLWAEVC